MNAITWIHADGLKPSIKRTARSSPAEGCSHRRTKRHVGHSLLGPKGDRQVSYKHRPPPGLRCGFTSTLTPLPHGLVALKLMPTVPNALALDACGAPSKTSAFQVIAESVKPAATTVASSSASSRAPAIQPVHRPMFFFAPAPPD